jgi:hypothetical protein
MKNWPTFTASWERWRPRWPFVRASTAARIFREKDDRTALLIRNAVAGERALLTAAYQDRILAAECSAAGQIARLDKESERARQRMEDLLVKLSGFERETFLSFKRIEDLTGKTLEQASGVNARLFGQERIRELNRKHRKTATKKKGTRKQTR